MLLCSIVHTSHLIPAQRGLNEEEACMSVVDLTGKSAAKRRDPGTNSCTPMHASALKLVHDLIGQQKGRRCCLLRTYLFEVIFAITLNSSAVLERRIPVGIVTKTCMRMLLATIFNIYSRHWTRVYVSSLT